MSAFSQEGTPDEITNKGSISAKPALQSVKEVRGLPRAALIGDCFRGYHFPVLARPLVIVSIFSLDASQGQWDERRITKSIAAGELEDVHCFSGRMANHGRCG